MVGIKHLISHRFRGFSKYENTIAGLNAALNFGVLNLEFDIRVAKCGTPMIYHDEYARDARGRKRFIKDIMASDFASVGGIFAQIPTADALLSAAAEHPFQRARLLIDIKDAGFEEEIHALVRIYRLQDRVVWVSWLPEVLYAMHDIAPDAPLCLSHWCKSPNRLTRSVHKVYTAKNGLIPREGFNDDNGGYVHGRRSGWYVKGPLRGELRDLIAKTNGSICVPQNMVTRSLVDDYHADGIDISTFSYVAWRKIKEHKDRFNIDLYFIDNKIVFDEL